MRAMLLAAGRGERMRPLSDTTPKPLLTVAGRPLIAHLIGRLAAAGVRDLVVNHAWLGECFQATLGDGSALGVCIRYSAEPAGALDSGGAIRRALPLLGASPFLVVNADLWTDFPFQALPREPAGLAHLVLVDNPGYHPEGDFALDGALVRNAGAVLLTFSGIGVYRPALFAGEQPARFSMVPLLRAAAARDEVTGEHFRGEWVNVGTPPQLAALRAAFPAPA